MKNKKIVMLGDSLIDWNQNSSYINYGHAGYKTRDVLWLLEEKSEINGDVGILLVGVNDILCGFEQSYTVEYYKKTVDELKKRFEKLILVSMLPSDTPRINKLSLALNKILKEKYGKEFLDIYDKFLDRDGILADRNTVDGIHLNHDGYAILNFHLENMVDKILNYPDRESAERELAEAKKLNPGRWITHSQYAALACEKIAKLCPHLDSDKAYMVGLLHDIGRRVGIVQDRHMLEGYKYCKEKGWDKLAQICMSHGYMLKDIKTALGKWDVSPEEYQEAGKILEEAVYDDYDKLIQMCDSLALPDGFCLLETRFVDVALRYGVNEYTVDRWKVILEIKEYFEKIIGKSIYEVLEVKNI